MFINSASVILIAIVILYYNFQYASGSTEYTEQEQQALHQFRQMMGNQLYKDYMSSDDFLIPWLRAKNMNIAEAKTMLEKSLKWRQANKIDSILTEDHEQMSQLFKCKVEGHDRDGRPLLFTPYGSWNLRTVAIAGPASIDKFKHYLDYTYELTAARIREANATSEHHNVTQALSVIDMSGYNLRQQGCLQCIQPSIYFVTSLEANWPGLYQKIILVNTPSVFQALFEIVKPFMSSITKTGFIVYGFDQDNWKHELLKLIPADQLPERYGGTKKFST